ncbi:MAG: diguanylate cyclase [Chloroflexales bacterium]|nr:diguanylate cyclase [Chloroflexales bacterium]
MANNSIVDSMSRMLFQQQFEALRQEYIQHLAERVTAITQQWQAAPLAVYDCDALDSLHRQTRSLAGSGASLGFSALAQVTHQLEQHFKAVLDQAIPPSPEQYRLIAACLQELHRTANLPDAAFDIEVAIGRPGSVLQHSLNESRLIYLVENNAVQAQELHLQIQQFGYQVRSFTQLEGLQQAVEQNPPAAIVTDIIFPEGDLAGIEAITTIQQDRNQPILVLFMSARDDITARLQAVRAGGAAYFVKPLDFSSLIDNLDVLTSHRAPEPYRILIIEDEPELATFYELTLHQSGMVTRLVTDPMQIMQPLSEFQPDLILMDIYMPQCSGLDLAKVIRQQEAYISIPIVFLSMETNQTKQLAAIDWGGDDSLIKPIPAERLVSTVAARVHRSRILCSFMFRDSLTGLLNPTRMKEHLEIEVARARRHHLPLSFAMIDIDHFKRVNDSYGHPAGDRVLKSLSQLLQQRRRRTNIIGRYDGEEFAVLLPNTDGAGAIHVMNEIRASFAMVRQRASNTDFSVMFSCGIATFLYCNDATALNNAADQAFYHARHEGRNRVILANHED